MLPLRYTATGIMIHHRTGDVFHPMDNKVARRPVDNRIVVLQDGDALHGAIGWRYPVLPPAIEHGAFIPDDMPEWIEPLLHRGHLDIRTQSLACCGCHRAVRSRSAIISASLRDILRTSRTRALPGRYRSNQRSS